MGDEKKNLDDAAKDVAAALETLAQGKSESALAKILIICLSLATGTSWLWVAEPLVVRVLQRLNNKLGKDAVAEIAKEVETEEGFRRVAAEVRDVMKPALERLFAEQTARGGLAMGNMVEVIESSTADAVARIGLLMHRLEERLAADAPTETRAPLMANPILRGSTRTMRGRQRQTGGGFEALAFPFGATPRIMFDLTNASRSDVRIVDIFIDIELEEVDVDEIWMWLGLARPIRKYSCAVGATSGRYRCEPLNSPDDTYLVLTPGELEFFSVDLALVPVERFHRVELAVEVSSRGDQFVQKFDKIMSFGTYDPETRTVTRDERLRNGGPSD